MSYTELFGWLSCVFFILVCCYSIYKRFICKRYNLSISIKKSLNYHCIFTVVATILALLHTGKNLINLDFSIAFISLLFMVIITLLGIVLKYFSNVSVIQRKILLYAHIILTTFLVEALLIHIISNYFTE